MRKTVPLFVKVAPSASPAKVPVIASLASLVRMRKTVLEGGVMVTLRFKMAPPRFTVPRTPN